MILRRIALPLAAGLALRAHVAHADPPAVRTLDLTALYHIDASDAAARRTAYDTLAAVACLQGLVNRTSPDLYLFYAQSRYDASINADRYWLTRMMTDPLVGRGLLDGRAITPVADLMAALDAFPGRVQGLVVWDENVPSTVNAAFVAAGADDLLVVRWDASPTSLYSQLRARGIPVRVWLVNEDGSSLFHDGQSATTLVHGTTRTTSGSAKVDAYRWAEAMYQSHDVLDPTAFGFMVDGWWLNHPCNYGSSPTPTPCPLLGTNALDLTNRDLLVARRGFPFDLSPYPDLVATDAPETPAGIDARTLQEILGAARAHASPSDAITVLGFPLWQAKYTTLTGLPAGHSGVGAEWASAAIISPYAAGLDAGGAMANASFFHYVPFTEVPVPQARPTPEDLVGNGFLTGLASNGGFEDGESGWTDLTTHHVVYTDGAQAHTGQRYLECNTDGGTDNNLYRDGPAVPAGTTVTLRAFARTTAATPVRVTLGIFGVGGTTEAMTQAFTVARAWSELRIRTVTTRAGHTATRGQINVETAGVNVDLDDVAFYQGDAAAGRVEPAHYVLWYVGDYDSAAWMYSYAINVWNAPGRGEVPFAWAFNGCAEGRFPLIYNFLLETRTPRDFFVMADAGAAYGDPAAMSATALDTWRTAGMRAARHLDTSAGWVDDGALALDAAHVQGVTPFDGDGVMITAPNAAATDGTIVDHAPLVEIHGAPSGTRATVTSWVIGQATASSTLPTFSAIRTTQGTFVGDGTAGISDNANLVSITRDLVINHSADHYRVVDPFTFFELARANAGGANTTRASYLHVTTGPVVIGQPIAVSLTVRNDGWETWHGTATQPYRVGFDVAATPQGARASRPYAVRADLHGDVAPGGTADVTATLPALTDATPHTLQIDMVHEGVTWFETTGDVPVQLTLVAHPASVADDAGVAPDAAGSVDVVASDDAATTQRNDGASGAQDGASTPPATHDGCGCRATPRSVDVRAGVLVVLALARVRRRARARGSRAGVAAS